MKESRIEGNDVYRRVSRLRKRSSRYSEYSMRRRSYERHRLYRHRSMDPCSKYKKTTPNTKLRKRKRASSVSSIESVICLGRYKKIPSLIILDDSSDEEKPPRIRNKRKYRKQLQNSSKINSLQNETDLLNMLQEMHVGIRR